MARVFIPPMLRRLTGGANVADVPGQTLAEVIDQLEARFPGVRARICDGDDIRPELSVSIGDTIVSRGLAEPVDAEAEVHFLPALGGG